MHDPEDGPTICTATEYILDIFSDRDQLDGEPDPWLNDNMTARVRDWVPAPIAIRKSNPD